MHDNNLLELNVKTKKLKHPSGGVDIETDKI
jgi:hypothetical protein